MSSIRFADVSPRGLCRAALLASALAVAPHAMAAPYLETFVMTAAGQSNFGTYSAPEPVYQGFFGGGNVLGFSIPATAFSNPANLAAAGIAGDWRLQSAATGVLNDSMSVNTSFNAGSNTYIGSASTKAQFGQVGVQATGALTGASGIGMVDGSEAYAMVRESMTFFSPTITNNPNNFNLGYAQYHFTIDGNLSSLGKTGPATIDALYKQGAGPTYGLVRMQADAASGTYIAGISAPYVGNASAYGFTASLAPGAVSLGGVGTFSTFLEPFEIGTAVDFSFGLFAYVIPGPDSAADATFISTARLTGIDIYDAFGKKVTDFTITSGSGTLYDANGAHSIVPSPVPEPSTAMLTLLGCALLAASQRLRRRGARA